MMMIYDDDLSTHYYIRITLGGRERRKGRRRNDLARAGGRIVWNLSRNFNRRSNMEFRMEYVNKSITNIKMDNNYN